MASKLQSKRVFPWKDKVGGYEITFTLMTPQDREALLRFTRGLSQDDILFLRLDITKPEVVDEWMQRLEMGRTITVLAWDNKNNILGYCSLHHSALQWTRHIGEIRVFVQSEYRGIGLARRLVTEMFQIAHEQKLHRIVVNIPRDQPHVRQMLEDLGFKAEALLTDWLMSPDGRTHDLLIMSHHVIDL